MRALAVLFALSLALPMLLFSAAANASLQPKAAHPAVSPCSPRVVDGVIPPWARDGFGMPKPRMNYELGKNGEIVALLWAHPLLSPPALNHNNKILWVSRVSVAYSNLVIDAQRMNGTEPVGAVVKRVVAGGPGPSIINLPMSGCWRFQLHWSGRTDSLDLRYVADPRSS
jgi:hypothetical protein